MNEYKIMIVDDEPDISELLEKALKIEGFQKIVKIGTGNEAVAAEIGMFYYLFAIPEPEGLSLADWQTDLQPIFLCGWRMRRVRFRLRK